MTHIEPLKKKKRISHMLKIPNVGQGMPSQQAGTASTVQKGMHNSLPSAYSNKSEVNLPAATYSQKKTQVFPSTSQYYDANFPAAAYSQKRTEVFPSTSQNHEANLPATAYSPNKTRISPSTSQNHEANLPAANYSQNKSQVFSSTGQNHKWHHKKFRYADKFPLMKKCLSEFKQIKHNRNITKQESHLARLPDTPTSEIIKSYLDNDSAQKTKKLNTKRSSMDESPQLKNNSNDSAPKPKPHFKRSSVNESYQLENNSRDLTRKTKKPNLKRNMAESFHLESSNHDSGRKIKKPRRKSNSMAESPQNIGDSARKTKKPNIKSRSIDVSAPVKIHSNDSAQKLKQFYEDLEDLKKNSVKESFNVKNNSNVNESSKVKTNSNDSVQKQRSLNLEEARSPCRNENTTRKPHIQNDSITEPSHSINNNTEKTSDNNNEYERMIEELKSDLLKCLCARIQNI